MPFFQNPFTSDFDGNWVLTDRQYSPCFPVPHNAGRGDEIVTVWTEPPYNLSGNDADGNSKAVLTLRFALNDFRNWADLALTITATSLANALPYEIVNSFNANTDFFDRFVASLEQFQPTANANVQPPIGNFVAPRIVIKQRQPATNLRFYILNTGAETVLKFNARAGVAEIPSYFSRHTVDNRFNFADSQNCLVELDPTNYDVDANLIDAAVDKFGKPLNLDHTTIRADYLLLAGRSGGYIFAKNNYNSGNLSSKIEYHAGAAIGDLARLTTYSYSGSTLLSSATIPYVLTSGDIITP